LGDTRGLGGERDERCLEGVVDGLEVLVHDLEAHPLRRAGGHRLDPEVEERALEAERLDQEIHLVELALGRIEVLARRYEGDIHACSITPRVERTTAPRASVGPAPRARRASARGPARGGGRPMS